MRWGKTLQHSLMQCCLLLAYTVKTQPIKSFFLSVSKVWGFFLYPIAFTALGKIPHYQSYPSPSVIVYLAPYHCSHPVSIGETEGSGSHNLLFLSVKLLRGESRKVAYTCLCGHRQPSLGVRTHRCLPSPLADNKLMQKDCSECEKHYFFKWQLYYKVTFHTKKLFI